MRNLYKSLVQCEINIFQEINISQLRPSIKDPIGQNEEQ